jgi:hypothetical protein
VARSLHNTEIREVMTFYPALDGLPTDDEMFDVAQVGSTVFCAAEKDLERRPS